MEFEQLKADIVEGLDLCILAVNNCIDNYQLFHRVDALAKSALNWRGFVANRMQTEEALRDHYEKD
jgi:hypothetical protein